MKPDLYCPKCKKFVEIIKERYREPITETRKWDGDTYKFVEGNIGEVEYEQLCAKCGTKLLLSTKPKKLIKGR